MSLEELKIQAEEKRKEKRNEELNKIDLYDRTLIEQKKYDKKIYSPKTRMFGLIDICPACGEDLTVDIIDAFRIDGIGYCYINSLYTCKCGYAYSEEEKRRP